MTGVFLARARLDEALSCERQGRFADAERLYQAILTEDPVNVQANGRLAAVAMELGQPERALSWARAALAHDPRYQPARLSVGIALLELARPKEAMGALEPLVRDAPDFAAAHYVLGQTLWALDDYDAATRSIERAIALAPEFAADHEAAQIERLDLADWRGYEASVSLTRKLTHSGGMVMNPVKFMHCTGEAADHQQIGRLTAARKYPPRPPLWTGQKRREGKIRLGYLSSDFYDHAVAHLAVGFLENHDRDRFELTAFSCCPPYASPIRERLVAAFDRFENLVDRDDASIARLIFERDIDVLVSLSGYADRARPQVLSWRPAPVQVNFLGYPGTLGAPYADYLIADHQVIPQDQADFYDENLALMPNTYLPTDDKAPREGGSRTREQEGLTAGVPVLMAHHATSKLSPGIFEVWMRILARTPGAVLWLQAAPEIARANLRREAQLRGVDPSRLVFAERLASRLDHMARHALADLYLDSLPYNAHSMASDALSVGLPIVTCRGNSFPGRVCAGVLAAAGFAELVAESLPDYEDLAASLLTDRPRLAALRARVTQEAPRSPLFDTAGYTRHLEAAYQTMYETAQAGLPPASFSVER